MKVTLLDTQTGKTLEVSNEANAFWWAHGNGCCDCNRSLLMEVETGLPDNICEGKHRFLIIASNNNECTLQQLNAGYPTGLLKKHGII